MSFLKYKGHISMKNFRLLILMTMVIFSNFVFCSSDVENLKQILFKWQTSYNPQANKLIAEYLLGQETPPQEKDKANVIKVSVEFIGSGVVALRNFEFKNHEDFFSLLQRLNDEVLKQPHLLRMTNDLSNLPEEIQRELEKKRIKELPLVIDKLFLGHGGPQIRNLSTIKNNAVLVFSSKISFGDSLKGANFERAEFTKVDFEGANLERVIFRGANLTKANLKGANLAHAHLTHTKLAYANLAYTNLAHVNLYRADLYKTIFHKAKLSMAKLRYANLILADLTGADLTGADLTGAHLYRANCREADLTGVSFKEALLRQTDLGKANLTKAYLRGVNLCWVNLEGAIVSQRQLRNAKYVRKEQKTQVIEPDDDDDNTCNFCNIQ